MTVQYLHRAAVHAPTIENRRATATRRWSRRVAVGGLLGAAMLGLAPSAFADTPAAPPAYATAAPATTATASPGDANQNYWASDNCHYFVQAGQWRSDMCVLVLQDASGNTIPNLYGYFQNVGNGQYGNELMRFDLKYPGYVAFASVTPRYTLGPWYRVRLDDPTRLESLGSTQAGEPIWIVPTATTQSSGGSDGYIDSPAQAQHWAQQAQINQSMADTWSLAAGYHKIHP